MFQLLGAIIGVFLISRLFWLVAKQWPDKPSKTITINFLCAALIIPFDYLVTENMGRSIMYAMCQFVVLGLDLLWLHPTQPVEIERNTDNWSDAEKEAFKKMRERNK